MTAENWQDQIPNLLKKIEDARSHATPLEAPPAMLHRLSVGGQDAAALSVTRKSLSAYDPSPAAQTEWSPSSWVEKPLKQEVIYPDRRQVEKALAELERLPPIVTPYEIIKLRKNLQDAALGKALVLHGGDCAELFSYCEANAIQSKIKLLLQMSLVLIWGSNKPVVRIGRMAGQYAKPRSSPVENINGHEIPSFRGDILNGYDIQERMPDPRRLVMAYHYSSATLNHIRGLIASGFADLHNPLNWNLGHVRDQGLQTRYQKIADSIKESLRFMRTIGADTAGQLETVDLFSSHEGLLLQYEQMLTRRLPHPPNYKNLIKPRTSTASAIESDDEDDDEEKSGWYDTSAHFLWIGDRTRQINGAHVEFFRGLENPIGIKVGPTMEANELVELLNVVNPSMEIGKVTLITRYGEEKIEDCLPGHIEAVRRSGHVPVWQCDPMHGNTRTTPLKIKTRNFTSIVRELSSALRIHSELNSFLGGVHLELTGEAVTECVGGSEGLVEEDLSLNYTTYCDPRLNEKQALELAFLVAGTYRQDG